jgi:nicotinamidase-related amidase
MSKKKPLTKSGSSAGVNAFLKKVEASRTPVRQQQQATSRLIFALDATASRSPTWHIASELQAEMFKTAANLGSLAIQLAYYRGDECRSSPWYTRAADLLQFMSPVSCVGGLTQIEKVLSHAIKEARQHKVHAVVFVGDCVEEDPDTLARHAGELGLLGVPVFMFQEGNDPLATQVFRQIARLSHGAHSQFDINSAHQLAELLKAVTVYATRGHQALVDYGRDKGNLTQSIVKQLPKPQRNN